MNTGSKIAARYNESMGDVCEDAITDPGCGNLALLCRARELDTKR